MNKQNLKFFLSITLLAIILSLSSGISSWFDGLPWANKIESLAIIIIIPFSIIIGRYFLSAKSSIIFLAFLLILKLTLYLGAPASGWKVKVSPNLKTLEEGNFMKTYFTTWQKDISAIVDGKGWVHSKQFPIDWFVDIKAYKGIPFATPPITQENFSTWMTVEGVVRLPAGSKLILLTKGTKHEELNAVSLEGENISIPIVHSFEEVKALKNSPLQVKAWSISGKFKYTNLKDNWVFQPLLVDQNGNILSNFWNDVFWQNSSTLDIEEAQLKFYWLLGKIFDHGLLVFLLIWFLWSLKRLWVQKILSTPIIIFGFLLGTTLSWLQPLFRNQLASLLSLNRQIYPINSRYLAITILIIGMGILAYSLWRQEFLLNKNKNGSGLVVFLLFAPAVLSYHTIYFWSDIGQVFYAMGGGTGDDYATYDYMAWLIVVDGQWLEAGEPVFFFQPGYRYFVAFYHWLFGPSAFAQRLSDPWFTIGTTVILFHLSVRVGLSAFSAILASMLFLSVALGQLVEWAAMSWGLATYTVTFFVMTAGYFLSKKPTNYFLVFIAGIFAAIGVITHMDRIGLAGGFACLLLNVEKGTVSFVWKNLFQQVRAQWKFFAVYLTVLGMGLITVILRNGFVGGHFGLLTSEHRNYTDGVLWTNFYLLLTGKPYLSSITSYPDTTFLTMVLVPGIIIGLMPLIWRPKILKRFPLTLSIAILGLLSPYLFLNIWAYAPRYSLQLLPFAALSLGYIFDYFYKKKLEKSSQHHNPISEF
jgi:hypothetical protein